MSNQNLHEMLQQASHQIQEANETLIDAQGEDPELIQQAQQQLERVEQELHTAQQQAGQEATENPQFQQAFEQLHNTRQHIQDLRHNNKDER
ncbi:hypothetical protein [Salinibacillus xinjiangensis]|uniref:DUF2524 family protein n=1 Tax=Salinibacillus xinjiangensis TaxID=1229268 RepID=A0A6G1X881_9BACI|nr:hypothetical protein [Salinibacillus xinjiangensis]MRG87139.1 hypothetical protein [Salinibacillus xinjiangensis]